MYKGYSGEHYGTFYGNSSNGQSFSPDRSKYYDRLNSSSNGSRFDTSRRDDSGRPLGNC